MILDVTWFFCLQATMEWQPIRVQWPRRKDQIPHHDRAVKGRPRTATKIPFMYSFFWELRGLITNFHIHVSFYIFPGSVHIFGCSKMYSRILEIYKSLTDIWVFLETEHHNSGLEIRRLHSFISVIHKWEADIYIEFSPALHLQCAYFTWPIHWKVTYE